MPANVSRTPETSQEIGTAALAVGVSWLIRKSGVTEPLWHSRITDCFTFVRRAWLSCPLKPIPYWRHRLPGVPPMLGRRNTAADGEWD
jgi:hypothetical protein